MERWAEGENTGFICESELKPKRWLKLWQADVKDTVPLLTAQGLADEDGWETGEAKNGGWHYRTWEAYRIVLKSKWLTRSSCQRSTVHWPQVLHEFFPSIILPVFSKTYTGVYVKSSVLLLCPWHITICLPCMLVLWIQVWKIWTKNKTLVVVSKR